MTFWYHFLISFGQCLPKGRVSICETINISLLATHHQTFMRCYQRSRLGHLMFEHSRDPRRNGTQVTWRCCSRPLCLRPYFSKHVTSPNLPLSHVAIVVKLGRNEFTSVVCHARALDCKEDCTDSSQIIQFLKYFASRTRREVSQERLDVTKLTRWFDFGWEMPGVCNPGCCYVIESTWCRLQRTSLTGIASSRDKGLIVVGHTKILYSPGCS